MVKKQFAVLGLGRFGKSVAITLAAGGCDVLAVDGNEDIVNELSDIVTFAVKADVTDSDTLKSLGISNFDGAIIGMGEDLQASVMATIIVKELGVPYVLTKAQNDLHAKILKKVGADMVVFPEKETGIRIANNLMLDNFFDAVELSTTYSMMELETLAEWVGKTLKELNLRAKFKINVMGIKRNDEVDINPDADEKLKADDVLIIVGENVVLNRLANIHAHEKDEK